MKVSIVGFGRFGKTLYRLLRDDFDILVYDPNIENTSDFVDLRVTTDLNKVYASNTIFYCVPISSFENVIDSHKEFIRESHLLIDVLSVKMHPKKVFTKYFSNNSVLLTHPMFGPDSSKDGFEGLPIVLDKELCREEDYTKWKSFFEQKGLRVEDMSSDEHDRLAANSQGVTHLIGRILEELGYSETKIDTQGARLLHQVKQQTCNDTWQLFSDLQTFNPYTKEMRVDFGNSFDKVFSKLISKPTFEGHVTFGIQGGKGSFNEQALNEFVQKHNIADYEVKYLFTTDRVLSELYSGGIDFGQFAIHNSVGGIVEESVQAMSKYKFKIVEEFSIIISHHLMKLPETKIEEINTIIAHPQVLKQCKGTLANKYTSFKKISGEGDLIDTANAARALSQGDLPRNYAILGPQGLSNLFGLEIVDENLQGNKENYTSFIMSTHY